MKASRPDVTAVTIRRYPPDIMPRKPIGALLQSFITRTSWSRAASAEVWSQSLADNSSSAATPERRRKEEEGDYFFYRKSQRAFRLKPACFANAKEVSLLW